MNGDPPRPEVVDAQHTADDIAAQIVKDQDFPDWIPVFIQDRGGVGDQAAVRGRVQRRIISRTGVMIQVEEFLN